MKEVSVFDYLDYRAYLKSYFAQMKQQRRYFSYRYFSKIAGFKTSSVIKLVIDGKRNLSRTSMLKIARAIGLTATEQDYFTILVLFNQCRSAEEKSSLLFALSDLRGLPPLKFMEPAQYEFYKEWYHSVVRECCELSGLDQTPASFSRAIWPRIHPAKVRESFELLESLRIISKDGRGRYRVNDQAVTTEHEPESEYVAHFNREMIRIALQAALRFPKQQREISGVTLRISRKCFTEMKAKLRNFKKELLQMALADQVSDHIYQLNFQLFPLVIDPGDMQ